MTALSSSPALGRVTRSREISTGLSLLVPASSIGTILLHLLLLQPLVIRTDEIKLGIQRLDDVQEHRIKLLVGAASSGTVGYGLAVWRRSAPDCRR